MLETAVACLSPLAWGTGLSWRHLGESVGLEQFAGDVLSLISILIDLFLAGPCVEIRIFENLLSA